MAALNKPGAPSQRQVADAVGLSKSQLNGVYKGRTRTTEDKRRAIANHLGFNYEQVISADPNTAWSVIQLSKSATSPIDNNRSVQLDRFQKSLVESFMDSHPDMRPVVVQEGKSLAVADPEKTEFEEGREYLAQIAGKSLIAKAVRFGDDGKGLAIGNRVVSAENWDEIIIGRVVLSAISHV